MCETIETGKTHETFEKAIVAIIVTVATTEIVGQSDSIRIWQSDPVTQYPVYFESDENIYSGCPALAGDQ